MPSTALPAHDAPSRVRQMAKLPSTQMAERVHSAVGFRDLGRIVAAMPQDRPTRRSALRGRQRPPEAAVEGVMRQVDEVPQVV